ncbi:MAG: hypothetical protein UR43_C0032G0006 [candidate division TM6 bacterium GW2011_GWF2_33_332]|nr:MAG: hypothetical protein UR43_C0032G0006 [candidate division TM6 bacterium GW2011_GWF2_33_332]
MKNKNEHFKPFSEYKTMGHTWITLAGGEYYPDVLIDACELYQPVLSLFGKLLKSSESSERLFMNISEVKSGWMRIQLARIFRKYISPETPVEMLKKKTKAKEICEQFGKKFRPVEQVQVSFEARPMPDETLCALLWEYKDRGKKGYDLTERFFELVKSRFPDLEIIGPERAGRDVLMKEVFNNYPNPNRPVDFVIKDQGEILAIGLARYDSDRGGAQEDDRTGGYANCANEILTYTKKKGLMTKVIFINDGPGLLLGSMWNDYSKLEESGKGKIIVSTLRMIPERLTLKWLKS